MDSLSSIEFIDLSDVEEKEKNWILNSLRTWDPNVQVPWKRTYQQQINSAVSAVPQSNLQITTQNGPPLQSPNETILTSISPIQQSPHHIYQTYPIACYPPPVSSNGPPLQYHTTTMYQNIPYHHSPTELPMTFVQSPTLPPIIIQNNVNYPGYDNQIQAFINPNLISAQNDVHNFIVTQEFEQKNQLEEKSEIEDCTENVTEQNGSLLAKVEESPTDKEENKEAEDFKPVNKSWASLFGTQKNSMSNENKSPNASNYISNTSKEDISNDNLENISCDKTKYKYDDPVYYRLGEFISDHIIDHKTISLQPRGLINRSNYCYINSILQAMLACPPVYNLLNGVAEIFTTNIKRKHIPIIDNMARFVKEFHYLPANQRVSRRVDKNFKQDPHSIINCDTPFEPGYIYKMLNGLRTDTFVVEGRQEDAEEFLGCLLNGLNDEMLELMKLVGKQKTKSVTEVVVEEQEDDKEWQVMGPKNKGCVTRRIDVVQTPLSEIFCGHLRTRLHRSGDKSTDNIQPFFTLQLNIEKVTTVKDALEALVCKNQLEGVTSSKTNEEVEAWQQVTIEELPYVLVLHLKCFDYKLDGCTKIIKALEFPIDLKIDSKLLSSKTNYTAKEKQQYKLFAVVYHDGKEASKGHYLTDAYHVGYSKWLRYDDASVKAVPEEQVLKPHGTRVPYLLFYRRSDSIRSK